MQPQQPSHVAYPKPAPSMHPPRRTRTDRQVTKIAAIAALSTAACISACISGCIRGKVAREVSLEEFRSEQNAAAHPGDLPEVASESVRLDPKLGFDSDHGERGVMDIAVFPGPPERSTLPASSTIGDPTVIDIKVGEVIGDAIFASEFFDELMATRLTTEAEQLSEAEWVRFAIERIREELDGRVQQTLFVENARSELTPQQQQGLAYFLDQIQNDLLSRNRGSESLLSRNLQEEQGKTIEEVRSEREASILFQEELRRIRLGVQIASADIAREYELNYGSYNYGQMTLRVIRVSARDAEAVELIEQQLASGEDFETVARLPQNQFKPDEGGLWERSYKGDFEKAAIVGDNPEDPRNIAIRALAPGQTSPPVEAGSSVYWYHCIARRHTGFTLAEAQRHIENKLYNERAREALERRVEELMQDSSITRLDDMRRRLFEYAYRRFYLPVARAKEAAAQEAAQDTGGEAGAGAQGQ